MTFDTYYNRPKAAKKSWMAVADKKYGWIFDKTIWQIVYNIFHGSFKIMLTALPTVFSFSL